jgi:hypothetical protein
VQRPVPNKGPHINAGWARGESVPLLQDPFLVFSCSFSFYSSLCAFQLDGADAQESGLGYYFDRRPHRLVVGVRYACQGDPGSSWRVESRASVARQKER